MAVPSKTNLRITFMFLIVILLITGCRKVDPELQRNRQLWKQNNATNYNFVIMRYQGGMYMWAPVLVQVRNGDVISTLPTEKVGELVKSDYHDFDTIEKTLDNIEKSHEAGDQVVVKYNKELGYPESIRVIPRRGGTDTEFTIEISKFDIVR